MIRTRQWVFKEQGNNRQHGQDDKNDIIPVQVARKDLKK
jgi:hypothetical protein